MTTFNLFCFEISKKNYFSLHSCLETITVHPKEYLGLLPLSQRQIAKLDRNFLPLFMGKEMQPCLGEFNSPQNPSGDLCL